MVKLPAGARGVNLLLGALIIIMLAFSIIFISLLTMPIMGPRLDLFSIAAAGFALVICLPLAVHLWRTSTDARMRSIFRAFVCGFSLLLISALLWYPTPIVTGIEAINSLGKILMLLSYFPILVVLTYTFKKRDRQKAESFQFIKATCGVLIFVILVFVGLNFYRARENGFDVAIFTLSIAIDIILITLAAMLTINAQDDHFRFIYFTMIIFYLMSLTGDGIGTLSGLGLYSRAGDQVFAFDAMFIFMAVALLLLTLNRLNDTKINEVSQQLHGTRNLMQDLIMQWPDAICIFDANGNMVRANTAFLRLVPPDKIEGHERLNLFRDVSRLISNPVALDSVREGRVITFEESGPSTVGDARQRYYSGKIFPTVDAAGAINSFTLFLADVTMLKNHETELQAAKDDAELYLDLMGHDINNMHQIAMGYLEYARDTRVFDEQQRQFVEKPYDILQRSSRLIHNVRKLQMLKSGELRVEQVDLYKLLADTVSEFRDTTWQTITLSANGEKSYPVLANNLLQDVFQNLIGNAIKHAGKDQASIAVDLRAVEENGSRYYRIVVEDDGRGIPDDYKQRIFSRMVRGPTNAKGTGLGLYLARSLVDSYKGIIWVEDRVPGDYTQGARFVVILPAIEE